MRKILLLSLPIAIFSVISLSFFLLLRTHTPLLPISEVSAAGNKKRLIHHTPIPRFTKVLKPTKIPTPTPTLRPTATPIPLSRVTPVPRPRDVLILTPIPTNTPTPTTIQPIGDSVQAYIMKKINEYRASQGKSSVSTDTYTCDFANVRVQEIVAIATLSHDGFTNRINSHTLPYPAYHNVTENLAMTSNYQDVVAMWANSPGHAENMRADTPYVCVEKSGNFYVYEGWRP